MHRLIPFGILGFVMNISSGLLFMLTEPDQYIYNPSFHLKLLFLTIGGLNAGTFYLTCYRQVFGPAAVARRSATCEGDRGDLVVRVGRGDHVRTPAHVLSPGAVSRRRTAACSCNVNPVSQVLDCI